MIEEEWDLKISLFFVEKGTLLCYFKITFQTYKFQFFLLGLIALISVFDEFNMSGGDAYEDRCLSLMLQNKKEEQRKDNR